MTPKTRFIKKSFYLCLVMGITTFFCGVHAGKQQAPVSSQKTTKAPQKEFLFIVYVAAVNNLATFAPRNIEQMRKALTHNNNNDLLTVFVHVDIVLAGNQKATRRYLIEKNKMTLVNEKDTSSQSMDSGDPQTLVSCCKWAIENYPAKKYALILWNHGTGILDPNVPKMIDTTSLFVYNPISNQLEVNRNIEFLDYLYAFNNMKNDDQRGICWDDITGNFLTNRKLDAALTAIRKECMQGKKFDLIGFDACLMSMLEVANLLKPHARNMVSSQEVILGAGWNYHTTLAPVSTTAMSTREFATHIVQNFAKTYSPITGDYTLAALDLDRVGEVEKNVDTVANLLLECLALQKNKSVTQAIKASYSKNACTHFDEPSYIDLHHFYSNLQQNLDQFNLQSNKRDALVAQLATTLRDGKELITQVAYANAVGKGLSHARGISIYFPSNRVYMSYATTPFAQSNSWDNFLRKFLTAYQ